MALRIFHYFAMLSLFSLPPISFSPRAAHFCRQRCHLFITLMLIFRVFFAATPLFHYAIFAADAAMLPVLLALLLSRHFADSAIFASAPRVFLSQLRFRHISVR